MKQLLVLSGKGGTGKTTVTAAFVQLGNCQAFADCDVDAPNLHLVVKEMPEPEKSDYYGLEKAGIDSSVCTGCGACGPACRFGAIRNGIVHAYECEGCGVCERVCPEHAIHMTPCSAGTLYLYGNAQRVFSTAQLKAGGGTSGKLVSAVKKQLFENAGSAELAIIDGSPGIGCPVMASMSGVDLILVVTEPTVSGIHDMKRIIDLAAFLKIRSLVCVNKYDINLENTRAIEEFCQKQELQVIGKIPFDRTVIQAVNNRQSIAAYPDSPAGKAITEMWKILYQTYMRSQTNENCRS